MDRAQNDHFSRSDDHKISAFERLARVRVVLSRTSHPGNIGATARAMKTMGLSQLVLVQPKRYPHADARARASNATDVLDGAKVVSTIDEAFNGTVLTIATASHAYELSQPLISCREAAQSLIKAAAQGDVAILFGTEAHGLDADEVRRCVVAAHIPSNPEYTSLNLAAAVQIFAYETRLAAMGDQLPVTESFPLATDEEIEKLHEHFRIVLAEIGFFDPQNPKRLLPRLRRLIARARPEKEEVHILRGLLKSAAQYAKRRTGD